MAELELVPGWFACADRYLWHGPTKTVVLADVHLGYEVELAKRGNFFVSVNMPALRPIWNRMAQRGPRHVIVAGDLFDAKTPDAATIGHALELFGALPRGCAVTVTPGNHDPALRNMAEIFDEHEVHVSYEARVEDWVVAHGHDLSRCDFTDAAGVIVGHQHPAVRLGDRVQTAKMMCFAVCEVMMGGRAVKLINVPAFSPLPLGTSLLNGRQWMLDCEAPAAGAVRIGGIVKTDVLDFGLLSGLETNRA